MSLQELHIIFIFIFIFQIIYGQLLNANLKRSNCLQHLRPNPHGRKLAWTAVSWMNSIGSLEPMLFSQFIAVHASFLPCVLGLRTFHHYVHESWGSLPIIFLLYSYVIYDLGKPNHTLVSCWMRKPLPPRNHCTCWFSPTYDLLGPLHTRAKSCDHEIVRAKRLCPKAVSTHLQNPCSVVTDPKCSVKSYVTGPSTNCYFIEFKFTHVLTHDKIE